MKTQTFYRHLSSKPPQSLYKRKLLKSQAVSTGWTGHLCLFAVIQLQGFQVIGGASSCFLLWRGFSSASKASLFTLICSEPDVSMWLTTVRKNNKATSAGNRKKKPKHVSAEKTFLHKQNLKQSEILNLRPSRWRVCSAAAQRLNKCQNTSFCRPPPILSPSGQAARLYGVSGRCSGLLGLNPQWGRILTPLAACPQRSQQWPSSALLGLMRSQGTRRRQQDGAQNASRWLSPILSIITCKLLLNMMQQLYWAFYRLATFKKENRFPSLKPKTRISSHEWNRFVREPCRCHADYFWLRSQGTLFSRVFLYAKIS